MLVVINSLENTFVQIKVDDFFRFFFSDEAVSFVESFHKQCGDTGDLFPYLICLLFRRLYSFLFFDLSFFL